MHLGYNTNGFVHHRLGDALVILAELGYRSVAITLDYHHLNPFDADLKQQLAEIKKCLQRTALACVIETGARFLLDPRDKHQPTLISPRPEGRSHRLDFLFRAVDVARELEADAVSFWSGSPRDDASFDEHMQRLVDGCTRLCDYAAKHEVRLAFEPEPGMFIDTMERFENLYERIKHPAFGLTIDVGHLHCLGEFPIADHLRRWQSRLWNLHIEDMRQGIHDHLMFGDGEIDFGPVFKTLQEIGYPGGVHVELSRHSHDAVNVARKAIAFLRNALKSG